MENQNDVDCEKCVWGIVQNPQSIVCGNYGDQECDPFGQCGEFEPVEDDD